jgi:hypothetical protein
MEAMEGVVLALTTLFAFGRALRVVSALTELSQSD